MVGESLIKPLDPNWRCSYCGGQHDRVTSLECYWRTNFHCPRCGAKPGGNCIDVRIHRARKMQAPDTREIERQRSATRYR
jgi:hypothetical protein